MKVLTLFRTWIVVLVILVIGIIVYLGVVYLGGVYLGRPLLSRPKKEALELATRQKLLHKLQYYESKIEELEAFAMQGGNRQEWIQFQSARVKKLTEIVHQQRELLVEIFLMDNQFLDYQIDPKIVKVDRTYQEYRKWLKEEVF